MKEAINANIGQQVFTLDRDAYDRLTIYLNDVRRHITSDTEEVMNDIEIRIAEILREELPSAMMVVTLAMVERAIARIGAPEDFETENNQGTTNNRSNMNSNVLRRSRTDRSIAGVCGGLAKHFGIDSTILRIVMLCLILFGGMSLWVYIIMWLLIPEE
ncbi:MAG: PspC domain-containing protein [Alistipes sp.]|nr:PspC domain-containing protein [Alistipes sp.]